MTSAAMAALSAGTSVASTVGSGIFGAAHATKAHKRNIKMWQRTNRYNSPERQMKRLKAAGLNPNLIYGSSPSGAAGSASPPPSAKNIEHDFELGDIPQALAQHASIKQTKVQTDNLRKQGKVIEMEEFLKAAQIADLGVKTARSQFDLGLAEQLKNTTIDGAQESVRQLYTKHIGMKLDNTFKSKSMQDRIADVKQRVTNAKASLTGIKLKNELMTLEKEWMEMGLTKNDALHWRLFGRILGDSGFKINKPKN